MPPEPEPAHVGGEHPAKGPRPRGVEAVGLTGDVVEHRGERRGGADPYSPDLSQGGPDGGLETVAWAGESRPWRRAAATPDSVSDASRPAARMSAARIAVAVVRPATPSAGRSCDRWNLATAAWVAGPKPPSGSPPYPNSPNAVCSSTTRSPLSPARRGAPTWGGRGVCAADAAASELDCGARTSAPAAAAPWAAWSSERCATAAPPTSVSTARSADQRRRRYLAASAGRGTGPAAALAPVAALRARRRPEAREPRSRANPTRRRQPTGAPPRRARPRRGCSRDDYHTQAGWNP